jgi:hypothetical protein
MSQGRQAEAVPVEMAGWGHWKAGEDMASLDFLHPWKETITLVGVEFASKQISTS